MRIPVVLRRLAGAPFLLAVSILSTVAHAQQGDAQMAAAVKALQRAAPGSVSVTSSRISGHVSFMVTQPGVPVPIAASPTDPAEMRAATFLGSHGAAFGVLDLAHLRLDRATSPDPLGMEHLRYQQLHDGVPVTGAELAVHLHGAAVVAVHAKILAIDEALDPVPSVDAADALAAAQILTDKHFPGSGAVLSEPRLEVFNRGLLEGRSGETRLAWFIEARAIRLLHYIWIDAHTGARLLDFNQMPHALSRQVYTANDTSVLPGTLVRSEGGAATGDADADFAYDFAGDTYNYYLTQHGRDSFDGMGSPIISTVHYCDAQGCPLANAFWSRDIQQMVYGTGYASADDVVAHELTHAVTEHSANLFYYAQSGALNESYSDIFGETVDLLNGRGNDAPAVRWLLGEDLSIGAIRNMMNPNASAQPVSGQPARVSDFRYACSLTDNRGIHINSGVPNHAYALMVDGGTYNGFRITGIGLIKAGKVQYRALTTYLLATSDFLDNYDALKQSCRDLIGTAGITPGDCAQVAAALDAVELSKSPSCSVNLPYCPARSLPQDLFFDDLENLASGNWAISTLTGTTHWTYPSPVMLATSGRQNFWGYDAPTIGDSVISMTHDVSLPAGARMQFNHTYFFESIFDGGVVEYSTNGGATWTDAGTLISAGTSYGGTISSSFGNPLAGRSAFVGDRSDYTATQLNLSGLAGQSVRFRFRIGTDRSFDDLGWLIDDIRIYTCGPEPARLINISTRGRVEMGDNVMIGGFVIEGTTLRKVLVRALGPSLTSFGVPGVLPNPSLQIFSGPNLIARNDSWQVDDGLCQANGYGCGTPSDIAATAFAPSNPLEPAILVTLPPGPYTAIVSGAGGSTGVGLVEVYDVDRSPSVTADLINISTRGRVGIGDDAMIGGFVIGGAAAKRVVVRAVGPSLASFGVPGVLPNPSLLIFDGSTAIAQNDNWQAPDPLCQATGHTCGSPSDIVAAGRAPSDPLESAIMITLPPGAYTAIVRGVAGATGVGLVEVFEVP